MTRRLHQPRGAGPLHPGNTYTRAPVDTYTRGPPLTRGGWGGDAHRGGHGPKGDDEAAREISAIAVGSIGRQATRQFFIRYLSGEILITPRSGLLDKEMGGRRETSSAGWWGEGRRDGRRAAEGPQRPLSPTPSLSHTLSYRCRTLPYLSNSSEWRGAPQGKEAINAAVAAAAPAPAAK